IDRQLYLNKLINRMNNGMIKVITGIRRCGNKEVVMQDEANIVKQYEEANVSGRIEIPSYADAVAL
ncbi:MAG: hypothetical protein K6G40_01120, partial [Eubacterium sp.]|nr:hypothetical protein [Eubacterium sp.]